jgi:type I restriction enzyme M protein
MDASQYKDYILTLLFVKYVSDKAKADPNALLEVPKGGSFDDMARLKGDKEIGDKINKIIRKLAEANDLKGVIDQADFNDEAKLGRGKEMQDRLSKLIAIFEGLDFSANRAEGDDLLGDAYEYLMRHFATESGKSKGQFYTPAEVSRVMAQVIGIEQAAELDQPTVYDPTCGSGSLLIKAADAANTKKLAIYGQEMDVATWSLARMNMILHGHPTAEIWHGNTLAAPGFKNPDGKLKTFDFAVANPPFSQKNWTSGLDPEHDEFDRFEYGIPPAKNGDYAFLLHLIKSLKSRGKGAIILPHGVLFRGNREADIRRNLVRRGLIKGIIGLPPNLFYGTGIPACIIVIDKEGAGTRRGIFLIDASRGYIKDGNKNRLREQDIRKIVDVFRAQMEIPGYSRLAPLSEIEANDYNLNIPRYIDSSEAEDLHDLEAHLKGGIPQRDVDALRPYWDVFRRLRTVLFRSNERPGYLEPRLPPAQVRAAILEHPDYRAFHTQTLETFAAWRTAHEPRLRALRVNDRPRDLIHELANNLLARFRNFPLIDPYDIYQALMDYWYETLQDDAYLIAAVGWLEAARPRLALDDKQRSLKETPDLIVDRQKYKMDLLPPSLLIARYFAAEQAEVERLQAAAESAEAALKPTTAAPLPWRK